MNDSDYMSLALEQARLAAAEDEVPIGAVLVFRGEIAAVAHNRKNATLCATHHAEILAIEEACRKANGWRLPGAALYVTLEPCPMCAGAIIEARIARVIYGASDKSRGALGGAFDLSAMKGFFRPTVTGGLLAEESQAILAAYFREKRAK